MPADPARPALSDVRLSFSQLVPVGRVTTGGAVSDSHAVLVRSAGSETGDFAHIYVDGVDRSPNGRGYNLVALGPGAGSTAAQAASFDTHGDPAAGARLAAWVAALPAGTVVAGAVRDEASMSLGPEAVRALAALGVKSDLTGHFRWGHAFIGVKGGAPGTADEAMSAIVPAQVASGPAVTAPDVAAYITDVTITPVK